MELVREGSRVRRRLSAIRRRDNTLAVRKKETGESGQPLETLVRIVDPSRV